MVIALPALFFLVVLVVAAKVISNALQDALLKKGNVTAGPATEFSPLTEEQTEAKLPKPVPPMATPTPEPPPQPGQENKPGNVAPIPHVGQEDEKKDECAEQRKNYPVHAHEDAKAHAKPKDSHHVIQNAHFWEKGGPLESICKGYQKKKAMCIPLQGPSGDDRTKHGIVTYMQNADAKAARDSGTAMTFGGAMSNSENQLRAAGVPEVDIRCIMVEVLAYFKKTCTGISSDTVVRTPYQDFED